VPAPAYCVSLHSLSLFHFTAKFLMIRLHCAIIISKFQFKIIGIFYLPPGEHKLQESRDRGIFSPVLPRQPKPGSRDTVNPPLPLLTPQVSGHAKPDTQRLLHFGGDLQRWGFFNQHAQLIPLLKSSLQTIQTTFQSVSGVSPLGPLPT